MDTFFKLLGCLLVIILFILFPFGLIWALNTLFSLTIAYTFSTWLAALILLIAVGGTRISYSAGSSKK